MKVFNDYDTSDILRDKPYVLNGTKIYPVKLKDYDKFKQYAQYIIFSHEHLKLDYEESLLPCVIMNGMLFYNNGKQFDINSEYGKELYIKVISEICDMFSIVCRDKMNYKPEIKGFSNENKTIVLLEEDFDDIRTIILKQNLIFEPKIYESEMQQKWAEKVKRSRSKSNNSDLCEVINIVSCEKKISYEEIDEYNILQLYADYYRFINTKEAETIALFRTVASSDTKLPNVNFSDAIFKKLYTNPDDDLFVDAENHKLMKVMEK